MFDAHAQKNILIVMLQIFDNLFHYKDIVTVQWIKRLKLCMVTMATLPPAKELKIQVVSWQNEIRTLDVLKSPTCMTVTCKLLTEHHLGVLGLNGGCTGSSESIHVSCYIVGNLLSSLISLSISLDY